MKGVVFNNFIRNSDHTKAKIYVFLLKLFSSRNVELDLYICTKLSTLVPPNLEIAARRFEVKQRFNTKQTSCGCCDLLINVW